MLLWAIFSLIVVYIQELKKLEQDSQNNSNFDSLTDVFYFTRKSLPPKARLFDSRVQWVTKTGYSVNIVTVSNRHAHLYHLDYPSTTPSLARW